MQRGNAAGGDQIPADLLNNGGKIVLYKLAILYTQCLMPSSVPESRKNANIILINTKGVRQGLVENRPISVLSVAYEVFTKLVANRIRTTLDFNQPNDQAEFRKRYSTIDRIHTINQVMEKCAEYNQALYIAFIDYKKVFDSFETSEVMQALRNQGVDESHVKKAQDGYAL